MRSVAVCLLAMALSPYQVGCDGCAPDVRVTIDGGPNQRDDAGVELGDGGGDPIAPDGGGSVADDGGSVADDGGSVADGGRSDAGALDGNVVDAGALDAGPVDAGGIDAGNIDGGESNDGGWLGYECTGGPTVFTTGMSARTVIGQPNFAAGAPNAGLGTITAAGFNRPLGVGVSNGKLFISDGTNNRVLVYDQVPTSNGATADHVVGQSNMAAGTAGPPETGLCDPQHFSFTADHLVVAEYCNNRVSFWRLDSLDGGGPSLVLGQPDLATVTANTGGISEMSLFGPTSARVHQTALWVSDARNNRALVFEPVPATTGVPATAVIGQGSFASSTPGGGPAALGFPLDVTSDGTRGYVIDSLNHRTLIYTLPISQAGAAASFQLGGWAMPATALSQNNSVGVVAAFGRLFVADRSNGRVLIWNALPSGAGVPADVVLGQPNFSSRDCNRAAASPSADTLCAPHFMYYDGCRLFVVDQGNHRVLIY